MHVCIAPKNHCAKQLDTSGTVDALAQLHKRRHENGSLTNDVDVGWLIVCMKLDTYIDYTVEQYNTVCHLAGC